MNHPLPIRHPQSPAVDDALAPSADAPNAPTRGVDSLQEIVSDIEGFLERWMPRLDQMFHQCCGESDRHEDAQPPSGLDQQRRQWQQQRQIEAQRLKEKADQLTDAWLRLEQEQRAVLQAQAAWKQRGGGPTGSAAASGETSGGESSASPASANAETGSTPSGGDAAPAGGARLSSRLSQQTPAAQFELLRHTIGEPPRSDR